MLFLAALFSLSRELHGVSLQEISHSLRRAGLWSILGAIGYTILSYVILSWYDFLGVGWCGSRLSYARVLFAAFVS